MATSKPKLQGYVSQEIYDAFEARRVQLAMSQSQMLEHLLTKALDLDVQDKGEPAVSRIASVEEQIENLAQKCLFSFQQIYQRLSKLEANSEPLKITSEPPSIQGNSLDGLPGDTPPLSEDSELLEITSEPPSVQGNSPDGLPGDTLPLLEDGELLEITSEPPSVQGNSPDGLPGDTLPLLEDSEPLEITSEPPSVQGNSPDGLPGDTLPLLEDSEPLEITSEPPSVQGNSPDGLPGDTLPLLEDGEPLEITSEPPSVQGNSPDGLPGDTLPLLEDGEPLEITSEPPSVQGNSPDGLPGDTLGKLVICKVDKADSGDQRKWRYFASFKQGFVEQLDQARTYYPDTVRQIAGRIGKSPYKAIEGEMISWRPLAELEQLLAVGVNHEQSAYGQAKD